MGESRVLFFAPEKWKFPIPSAYNTGRVSFQTRSERMIIMTKGIVKIKKNRAFVEQQNGEVEMASGQYVYLKVENCWIPVVVRYSARRKKWYFYFHTLYPYFLPETDFLPASNLLHRTG